MADITIREIDTRTELPECVNVLKVSFGTVAEDFHLTEQTAPTNPAFINLEQLNAYVAKPVRLFCMFDDERMIGCIAIEKSKNEDYVYFIERLAVIPGERHRGYGGSLLSYAFEKIREQGGQAASIGIINENLVLKEWYIRHGFVQTGCKRFDHLPFEVCFMKKNLESIGGSPFFCSWSGGKDCCLALYETIQNGGIPKALFTMMREDGKYSRSHGLPAALIERQAASFKIPAVLRASSWDDYESNFTTFLRDIKKSGVQHGVFGDIDLEAHLEWVERVCASAHIQPHEPLWKRERKELLAEFIRLGFVAVIIAVKQNVLNESFLGRTLDHDLVRDMEQAGIDASGEQGEYHTVVTDGPIFSSRIDLGIKGLAAHDGYCFLDVYIK